MWVLWRIVIGRDPDGVVGIWDRNIVVWKSIGPVVVKICAPRVGMVIGRVV